MGSRGEAMFGTRSREGAARGHAFQFFELSSVSTTSLPPPGGTLGYVPVPMHGETRYLPYQKLSHMSDSLSPLGSRRPTATAHSSQRLIPAQPSLSSITSKLGHRYAEAPEYEVG
jgi:hypothetical protein